MTKLRIGLTVCSAMPQYIDWLTSADRFGYAVEIIELPYQEKDGSQPQSLFDDNLNLLDTLDAVVFTGGWDVEPHRFGVHLPSSELERLEVETEPKRDDMEWRIAEKSLTDNVPILGICRGLQFINVVMGGTLYLDIEKQIAGAATHKKFDKDHSRFHPITLDKNSLLYDIIGEERSDYVSTRHHQAVNKIGNGLRVVGTSPDGIVEAMESDTSEKLLLLVQWHPERMRLESLRDGKPEWDNAFSENLLKGFLERVAEKKSLPAP